MTVSSAGSDILRQTRWLAIAIVPVLALAFVILFGVPDRTRQLFAWEIRPPMTAMMLGAAYAGGVWFFGRAAAASQWRRVKVGFPAVGTFAAILGAATVLHWDRFIHEAPAFWAWAFLYATTPLLVFGSWLRQRRADGDPRDPEARLPIPVRIAFGVIGAAMCVVAAGLFLAPVEVGGAWPWALTPLTARVMSAMFGLPGVVALGMAIDPRWSVARFGVEAQLGSIALILVGAWRDQASIHLDSPAGLGFVAGMGGLLVFLGGLYIAMERRHRAGY